MVNMNLQSLHHTQETTKETLWDNIHDDGSNNSDQHYDSPLPDIDFPSPPPVEVSCITFAVTNKCSKPP